MNGTIRRKGVAGTIGDGIYITLLAVSAVLTAVVTPVVQFAYARVYLENRSGSGDNEENVDHVAW